MKILVVGNGAREHAIAWKLNQSTDVSELFIASGNSGTLALGRNLPIPPNEVNQLLRFAKKHQIDLTVVGPEAPLVAGISNSFLDAGLMVFGPTKEAALIESSKSFAKELMFSSGIPTGDAKTFTSYHEAVEHLRQSFFPVVIKADGLAGGKGVVVAETQQEALTALHIQMEEKQFGSAGERVLIEEYLEGEEVSVFAFVDGEYVSPMVAARDYKRVGDGDVGPNTGGMGSYSPIPVWTDEIESQVRSEIMEAIAKALVEYGTPYKGVLYAGLMLTRDGPKVLEFNCRFGDPEAQVILPRLKTDLVKVMMMTALGKLDQIVVEWSSNVCVGVVVASGGYPGSYSSGYRIDGLEKIDKDVTLFHGATKSVNDDENGMIRVVTDGGRVMTVVAVGKNMEEAKKKAYVNVNHIQFTDRFYRGDIASFD